MIEPHHDGSPLCVPGGRPRLGDEARVRLRVPVRDGVVRVWARHLEDAEPRYAPARLLGEAGGAAWWEARIPVRSPLTLYRFLLESAHDAGPRHTWVSAAGASRTDVPDASDFRLTTAGGPAWATGATMYQVFPDRFARSAAAEARPVPEWALPAAWDEPVVPHGPEAARQFYGGDLDGIRERIGHLVDLGVKVLYLTPFFPAGSNHRYDAQSFRRVDPLLGGDAALIRLTEACHAHGIRVIGDLTTNHSGDTHEWFRAALADPHADERGYYYLRADGSYESWWGVPSLPKLDWASAELRREFVEGPHSVVAHWLRPPFNLDGWRIDVGNMTGRLGGTDWNHEVASLVRRTALEARPDALLVAESTADGARDFQGDTYHGAMSYPGFTRPLWAWLASGSGLAGGRRVNFFGTPLDGPPRVPAEDLLAEHRAFSAAYPWDVRLHSLTAIDTHDTARAATAMVPGGQEVAAVLAFTFTGMPLVFAGDEFGLEGVNGEDARTPLPWDRAVPRDLRPLYRGLGAQRNAEEALRTGSLRWLWAEGDSLAYVRELPDRTVLVVAARGACAASLPAGLVPEGWEGAAPALAVGPLTLRRAHDGGTHLGAEGPAAAVWLLPGPALPF
ncbi:alpha-amylase family glycosyl hydrolase [Sinomonas halotolerans]|uniref:Alpha-amylase family glycosyl hydrolase n=1 Tax=Sinomonas halotolerans TaxID=1644133 RepID=A0ABU9WXT3_9MICC